MPRDRWDDWRNFPTAPPLEVKDGLATSKRRGPMADTWWSKRFVEVLESYGLGGRMQRGRAYARKGQVVSLDVRPGVLDAKVQGSRRTPYRVTVELRPPTERQWAAVDAAFRSRVGFSARLLAGEVPPELEDVFRSAGVDLFPRRWSDLDAVCSCPDWENPCKHLAAMLYVFADRLDADPWLLLQWLGRTRDELLAHVRDPAGGNGGVDHGLPAWWPLVPGRSPVADGRLEPPVAEAPDPPDRVLQRLEPSGVDLVAGRPIEALLAPVYAALVEPELPPDDDAAPVTDRPPRRRRRS